MAMTANSETKSTIVEFSDAEVIALIAARDTRALEVLYDRYSRVVYSFSLRIVADPQLAEEILQEVFFRVWQQGAGFQSTRGSLITWLLSITHNLSIDEVRKRNRRPKRADSADPELVLSSIADEGISIDDEVWLSGVRSAIKAALRQLPREQADVIELAYFRGLTQREIAEALKQPLGTVKTRMRLGLQKLREQLGDSEHEMIIRPGVDEA
ncbi:sigma-70 family RNA polymerase sigma factor [soil metagenome]